MISVIDSYTRNMDRHSITHMKWLNEMKLRDLVLVWLSWDLRISLDWTITWIDASQGIQTDDQGLGVSQWATSGYISFYMIFHHFLSESDLKCKVMEM